MAFLKSIILLVFCIGWVKAVQYNDFDAEFQKIVHQIRQSMDNAWKWMRTAANNSYLHINQVFTARNPIEQGRHKYQDVIPSNSTPVKSDDTQIQSVTAPVPLTSPDTQNPIILASSSVELSAIPSNSTPVESDDTQIQSVTAPVPLTTPDTQNPITLASSSVELSAIPESTSVQKVEENSENNTKKVSEEPTEQPDSEPECITESANEEPINDQVPTEAQPEAEIPLQGEQDQVVNKLELPAVQDVGVGDSQAIESVPESDIKVKIKEPIVDKEKESQSTISDETKSAEFETRSAFMKSIYRQQSMFVIFLMSLMLSMYFYIFSQYKDSHNCPTILIGDSSGNLSGNMGDKFGDNFQPNTIVHITTK